MKRSFSPTFLSPLLAVFLLFGTTVLAPAKAGHKTELACTILVSGVEFEAWFRFDADGDGRAEFEFEGLKPLSQVEAEVLQLDIEVSTNSDTDGDARIKVRGNFAGLTEGGKVELQAVASDGTFIEPDDPTNCSLMED